MEKWTEARALKPSLRGEPTTTGESAVSDELLSLSEKLNRVSSAEDFPVECFLDLSEEDLLVHEGEEVEEEEEEVGSLCSSHEEQAEADNSSGSEPFLLDQLPLPAEDMAELEWVSRVVDDCSSPDVSLLFTERKALQVTQRWVHQSRKPCLSFRVPVKPRTKRSWYGKTVHPVWPFLLSTSGSSSLTSPAQRKKREAGQREKPKGVVTMFQRRCSHCGANNTPQWRTGPLGPKTLCNACGVRYKSGRLCPEYRPACSPTFSSEIHSNVHRKVLELKKVKESGSANQTESNSEGRET